MVSLKKVLNFCIIFSFPIEIPKLNSLLFFPKYFYYKLNGHAWVTIEVFRIIDICGYENSISMILSHSLIKLFLFQVNR